MNQAPVTTHNLGKRFQQHDALKNLTLDIPNRSVTGLVGRNGAGKSTLLRIVTGLYLPSSGECLTLGEPARRLRSESLAHIGYLDQEARYLDWLTVRDHLGYVASFYPGWDRALETKLAREFDIDLKARVGTLSPGNRQKLGLLLAVCHHPSLLILDEPASALDPIVREQVLNFLMSTLLDGERTIIVSSHILHDIERLVDHVVCLDEGQLVTSTPLDELQESYAEWIVTPRTGSLPGRFDDADILRCEFDRGQARLIVYRPKQLRAQFENAYAVDIRERRLTLEQIFPWLLKLAA